MDRSAGDHGLEDQRALQLAFELSMLGLSGAHSAAEQSDQMNPAFADDARSKKSQNMTECVPVPSSEHVAEIVGRQGKNTSLFSVLLVGRMSALFSLVSIRPQWRRFLMHLVSLFPAAAVRHVHGRPPCRFGNLTPRPVDMFVESCCGWMLS